MFLASRVTGVATMRLARVAREPDDPADTCPAGLDGDGIVGPFDWAVLLPNREP